MNFEKWCESGGGYALAGLKPTQLAKEAYLAGMKHAEETINGVTMLSLESIAGKQKILKALNEEIGSQS